MVLVTSYFNYLASALKVHWQAGAEAPALEQDEAPIRCLLTQSQLGGAGGVEEGRSYL